MKNFTLRLRHDRVKLVRVGGLLVLVLGLLLGLKSSIGMLASANAQDQPGEGIWQFETSLLRMADGQETQRALRLDTLAMRRLLAGAPVEVYREADDRRVELPLPMPDGSLLRFRIEESAVIDDSLSAAYPEIKTYAGYAIDDQTTTMRCDLTPQGFHATVIRSDQSVISIHPASPVAGEVTNDTSARYVTESGFTADDRGQTFQCGVEKLDQGWPAPDPEFLSKNLQTGRTYFQTGGTLRRYRVAIAVTWEYSNTFGGGNTANTVASIATWLNAVNVIYERELSVRLSMVNEPRILYTTERGFNSASDPFTNGNMGTMLGELGPVLASIPNNSFDLAHVLGTGGGGIAYLGVVCQGGTTYNGGPANRGVTLARLPLGNTADLSVFAHELGHQFGANHSFNGTAGSCNGRGSASSAFEPGSGMTIMSYAGLCGSDNTDAGRSGFFHLGSLREMNAYIAWRGICASATSTGNNLPTVNAGPDYTIPKNTPFELRATGSDPDISDRPNLTYSWEQTDAGGTYSNPPYNDGSDPVTTTRPIFRVYSPKTSATRIFPSLGYILNNANQPPATTASGLQVAENLPRVGRSLNFGVVLRDNRGGVVDDGVVLTVADNAGPFRVDWPSTAVTVDAGSRQTVTWQVANTSVAPVSTSQVRIILSTDGGQTFPITLLPTTVNDGSETVTFPSNIRTNLARVRVEAIGNIFFDISDVNFTIQAPTLIAAPSNLTASNVSTTSMDLNWKDNANNEAGYILHRSPNSGVKSWTRIALPVNSVSYSDSGLTASTQYVYMVSAIAPGGTEVYSPQVVATTCALTAAPTLVTATPVSTSQINLSWKDNATNESGYAIFRSVGSGPFSPLVQLGANATSYQDRNLTASTRYAYVVQALNPCRQPFSAPTIIVTTCAVTAPPTLVVAAPFSTTQINLSWRDNATNEIGYRITRRTSSGTTWTVIANLPANTTSYSDIGLSPSTSYTYLIEAIASCGPPVGAPAVSAATHSPTLPASNVTATGVSTTQINLSWRDNANNETAYVIQRISGTQLIERFVGASTMSFIDTGLTTKTSYTYRVFAIAPGGARVSPANVAIGTTK